jgi:hypothetical protein
MRFNLKLGRIGISIILAQRGFSIEPVSVQAAVGVFKFLPGIEVDCSPENASGI